MGLHFLDMNLISFSLADPKPLSPTSFIFMPVLEKPCQITGFLPKFRGGRPPHLGNPGSATDFNLYLEDIFGGTVSGVSETFLSIFVRCFKVFHELDL